MSDPKMMPIALVLGLMGCETPTTLATSCDPAMRGWVLECIEKANPHSDEEPEDNTAQCERTAIRLFCGPSCFRSYGGSNSGAIVCRNPSDGHWAP